MVIQWMVVRNPTTVEGCGLSRCFLIIYGWFQRRWRRISQPSTEKRGKSWEHQHSLDVLQPFTTYINQQYDV